MTIKKCEAVSGQNPIKQLKVKLKRRTMFALYIDSSIQKHIQTSKAAKCVCREEMPQSYPA